MKKIIYKNPNEVENFSLSRFVKSLNKSDWKVSLTWAWAYLNGSYTLSHCNSLRFYFLIIILN